MFKEIEHPTVIKVSRKELIEFQLKWILKDIMVVNDTQLQTLAFVYLHKNEAPDRMLEAKLTKNKKSIENIISDFRKSGIILGSRKETRLNEQIRPLLESIAFTVKLELND